ncbi:hypothetical protein GCM10009657_07100 [Oryzihumus leptocrescens]
MPTQVPTTSEAACPPGGLKAAVGPGDAAMGLRVLALLVTNCGSTPAALSGYPRLELYDADGNLLAVRVRHGVSTVVPDPGPKPVRLAAGESARTDLVWRNTVLADGSTAQTATHVAVTAPPAGRQVLALTVDVGTTGVVDVTAWHRADSAGSAS